MFFPRCCGPHNLTQFYIREDKDDITPMCPRLVVKDSDFNVRFPIDLVSSHCSEIVGLNDEGPICKLLMDWPGQQRFDTGSISASDLNNALKGPYGMRLESRANFGLEKCISKY